MLDFNPIQKVQFTLGTRKFEITGVWNGKERTIEFVEIGYEHKLIVRSEAALEKADEVIARESTIVLTRRESMRLLELIENPPPRNKKFLQAQARYQRMKDDAGSTPERQA